MNSKRNQMKYLLITSNQENNIAVLECDNNGCFHNEKLETALSEHFTEDIKANSVELISAHPIKFIAKCSNENLDMFNVELNETWLYKI